MDVRIVYSPSDAIKLAKTNPEKHVMFFAIGFETTAPSTALTLQRAKKEGLRNFSVFCNHVTIIPAIRAILDSPDMRLDGFIGPGHVSTVIGCRPYEWIAKNEKKPIVVVGLRAARSAAIDRDASSPACAPAKQKLKTSTSASSRGKGTGPPFAPWPMFSSCGPTSNGAALDLFLSPRCGFARSMRNGTRSGKFDVPGIRVTDPKAAQCGEVLKGVLKPAQCKLFGNECTPEHPVGALMVSSEGSCAAYYNYEHRKAALATSLSVASLTSEERPASSRRPRSAFANRKSRWLTAPAEKPAAA